MTGRSVSIVINTYNRAESLALTLESFEFLDYPEFEVVVVNGPSTDGTDELLAAYDGRIKVARCVRRNLSESRNIGIRHSSGDIVAFIDDDAYPDPAWLDDLVAAFEWDEVAAAGGPVFGHTGHAYQVFHSRADRFGNAWPDYPPCPNPTLLLAFPGSVQFTYTIGTNSAFRRDRLVEMGGFDEEFEYYLDEGDVCLRLTDRGFVVAALETGFVYHKFLPSDIRKESRAVRDWYQVLKSRFYFGLKHGLPASSFAEVSAQNATFVEETRADVERHLESGVHEPAVKTKFEQDLVAASNLALKRYGQVGSKERAPEWFDNDEPLLPFATRRPKATKLHVCFLSQEYPPVPLNGIGRVIHSLAEGLAAEGHVVRVLTKGVDHDRVDLENGVWVHRIMARQHPLPPDIAVPPHIWDRSASLLDELIRIDAMRAIDVVQSPNWDSEGIAALLDGRFPVVVGLYTPLKTVLTMDPAMQGAVEAGDEVLPALVELEEYVYRHADGYLACGTAVVDEIQASYDVTLDSDRLGLVPHGLPDLADRTTAVGAVAPHVGGQTRGPGVDQGHDGVRMLFVGRLEGRKGIDTLLACTPALADKGIAFQLDVVGDDTLSGPDGIPYRRAFEERWPDLADRVHFHGRLGDDELLRQYEGTDIFVAPSRFESFGLMLIEAMMFGKPVVCADVGGMREIVEDGVTGIRVPPDDVASLTNALERLLTSSSLRTDMGSRGRKLYDQRYSVPPMVEGAEAFYRSLIRSRPSR
jgi:glycogen(starch) synthase